MDINTKHPVKNVKAITVCASLILKHFIDLLDVKISFRSVYEALRSSGDDDVVLLDIDRVLKSYGMETFAAKAHPDALKEMEFPVISHISDSRNQEEFVVITGCSENAVSFVRYGSLPVTEPLPEFLKKWSGFILAAVAEAEVEEPGYDEKTKNDAAAREFYLANKLRLVDNFLTPQECEKIIDSAGDLLKPSMTTLDGKEHIVSNYRSSYSAFLRDIDPALKSTVVEKTKSILRVNRELLFEDLQCVSYSLNQEFRAHFDAGPGLYRRFTGLVYLNDGFGGGGTHFPALDKTIIPRRGSALFFENLDNDGHIDLYSFHAGLPVTRGKKFACNIWIK